MNRMHNKIRIVVVACISLFTTACLKTVTPPGTASLTVINSVVGSQPLVMAFGEDRLSTLYKNAGRLSYATFAVATNQFRSYTGDQRLRLYQYPDTTDKSIPLFDLRLNLPVGSMKTLYLTGTATQPDSLMVDESFPYHPASDSVTSMRFANLSPGSAPISINLLGQPAGSIVANLPYKGISAFFTYPATSKISSYTFEIRDAASGALLLTYSATGINLVGAQYGQQNKYLFHNNTLAMVGSPAGTGTTVRKTLFIQNSY